MQKYIIRRVLHKVEAKEIEVECWGDAVKQLKSFMDEPLPNDCVLIKSRCSAEFIGDT